MRYTRLNLEQFVLQFAPERRIYTVRELNAEIRNVLDTAFPLLSVSGEISGTKLATSGHYYFTLKDADAQIRCVCFRSAHRYFKFKPRDGAAVIARGRLDVYEARGEYQFIVDGLQARGEGALQVAFEKLKQRLAEEGLFDSARKRQLPPFPERIGIVTSPRGAVIADLIHVLCRRFPGLHIRLYPALVQGEGSVEEVCAGIAYFSRSRWADLLIVARGGGSLEDLWTFNEEAVARAIAASPVPVISAVGHETDITIADFVADLRAPTPSAAAELAVPLRADLEARFDEIGRRLLQTARYRVALALNRLQKQGIERAHRLLHRHVGTGLQRVDEQHARLREVLRTALDRRRRRVHSLTDRLRETDPRPRLARQRARFDSVSLALVGVSAKVLTTRRARVELLEAKLTQLSPVAILQRGYAIVSGREGNILQSHADTEPGEIVGVRLAHGRLRTQVLETSES